MLAVVGGLTIYLCATLQVNGPALGLVINVYFDHRYNGHAPLGDYLCLYNENVDSGLGHATHSISFSLYC